MTLRPDAAKPGTRLSRHPIRCQLFLVAWSGGSAADHPRGPPFAFCERVDGNGVDLSAQARTRMPAI